MSLKFYIPFSLLFFLFACDDDTPTNPPIGDPVKKITGMTIDGPKDPFEESLMAHIPQQTESEWIAIVPFAFTQLDSSNVSYDWENQWWSESIEGMTEMTNYARTNQLKILLKPHVWITDFGNFGNNQWVGDYDAGSEEAWQEWEIEYEAYILQMAEFAESMQIEMFAVGTEYKVAAVVRPDFWRSLIGKVKTVYNGELTYSANWDNYENIPFWEELDYIGVNSYFPLIETPNPTKDEIFNAWEATFNTLKTFHIQHDRPILFTEFGYMSVDYSAWRSWENEAEVDSRNLNLQAQANAFEALFERFWNEEWWAGGFIWKWQMDYPNAGGQENKFYTPENKPAEETIKNWYSKT